MELEARPRRHRSLIKPWDSRDAYDTTSRQT